MLKIIDLRKQNTPCQSSAETEYKVFAFPDGEKQIEFLEPLSVMTQYVVKTRITSADELFILMQTAEILNRNNIKWSLQISYLMTMRMDRVMDNNRPFSLKIVADIIKGLGAERIEIVEPHSTVTTKLIGATAIRGDWYGKAIRLAVDGVSTYPVICYPDKGALQRYSDEFSPHVFDTIHFDKVRELSTGKIIGLKCDTIEVIKDRNVVVIDDLVDGGATAIGIAEQLRQNGAKQIVFVCTHAVNEVGFIRLASTYDKVFITDSYRDWRISDYDIPNELAEVHVLPALD